MATEPEKMLYDETPEAPEVVDASAALDAEDFDWEQFLAGARPTRRAVKVYARADLVGRMEEVAAQYRDDMPAAQKKKIAAEVTALRDQFESSARWFVAEKRSSDWVKTFRKDTAARLGLDVGDESEDADVTDEQQAARRRVTLEQAAAQIVTPSGTTADHLERLGDINEGELNKVIVAVQFANTQMAQAASVVTRDFSQGRSGKTPPKRGSSSLN